MNRTDRLLAIVLELQAHGRRRAEDLAATFEISKRTIYRDIQALCEAGVPVVAAPGQGYSLVEGYFLPPLRFSADEAMMLLLGADLMAASFDAEYSRAARDAARKIAGALPERERDEVASLRQTIRFIPGGAAGRRGEADLLRQVRRAILARRRLRMDYHARHGAAAVEREVDPYGLIHNGNSWYMVGFCRLRQAIRAFRIERIARLAVLAATFERPAGFSLDHDSSAGRTLRIRVLFDHAIAAWVREAPSFYAVAEEERAEGLLVTLLARDERDVTQWLLGWGAHVRVLEPDSLRRRLAEEAARMLVNYEHAESLLT
ncbi:MAG TPA: YafY family protein [Herpetosiphonaceae bacterium]|nr:YafY family protein [Herpetosiphonaceae bacterium]